MKNLFRTLFLLALAFTATDATTLFPYFLRGTPAIIAPVAPTSTFIMAEGDSITESNATGVITYPIKYAPDTSVVTMVDRGHAGDTLAGVIGREASDTAIFAANPGYKNYILTLLINVNSCCAVDPITLAADTGAYLTTMRANIRGVVDPASNVYIIAATLPDFGGDPTRETWRATLNTGLTSLVPSTADALVNYAGDPVLGPAGACLDVSIFFDALHPTNLGQIYMERAYATVLNSVLAGPISPGPPSSPYASGIQQTALTLNWTSPTVGGYYTDFLIQYRVHGSGAAWTTFAHSASRAPTIYITGLAVHTLYDFQIAAVSTLGQSSFALITSVTTQASPYPNTFDTITAASLGVTFSNANLTANSTAQGFVGNAKTFAGKSSGKWYLEFKITKRTAGVFSYGLIDGTQAQALPNWLDVGDITNSASAGAHTAQTGFTLVNAPGLSPGLNDIVNIAFDASAKKAWIGVNNVYAAGGNPVTAANPWVTWSGSYTIYAIVDVSFNGDGITYSGASPFYSPPTGFSVLTP